MKTIIYKKDTLLQLLTKKKIATLTELKIMLGTQSTMTVFRKLKELNYMTSYSHGGKYYALKKLAKFNKNGLWKEGSALFSIDNTLINSVYALIVKSKQGYTTKELRKILNVAVDNALLQLVREKRISRKRIEGMYIYFSINPNLNKRQLLCRKTSDKIVDADQMKPTVLMNEIKAAIIIFYSLLDEQQRRLYAGLESLKIGFGGDTKIANLLNINRRTVSKGREDLLKDSINIDTIREKGAGRKQSQKKNTEAD
jgi:hypothetical protein